MITAYPYSGRSVAAANMVRSRSALASLGEIVESREQRAELSGLFDSIGKAIGGIFGGSSGSTTIVQPAPQNSQLPTSTDNTLPLILGTILGKLLDSAFPGSTIPNASTPTTPTTQPAPTSGPPISPKSAFDSKTIITVAAIAAGAYVFAGGRRK